MPRYYILDCHKKTLLEDEFSHLIEEDEIFTVRNSMDFLIYILPLSKEKLLIKNKYSTVGTLNPW